MKGCFLYNSFDVVRWFSVQNGRGQFSVSIPNNLSIIGAKVYFQSAAGIVASNGGEVLVAIR